MLVFKKPDKNYYPYSFATRCPLIPNRLHFLGVQDLENALENRLPNTWIFLPEDFKSLRPMDFAPLNDSKNLKLKITKLIVSLDSFWYYGETGDAQSTTLCELDHSITRCLWHFWAIQALLPPGKIHQDFTTEESKHIVQNAMQKMFYLLQTMHQAPIMVEKYINSVIEDVEQQKAEYTRKLNAIQHKQKTGKNVNSDSDKKVKTEYDAWRKQYDDTHMFTMCYLMKQRKDTFLFTYSKFYLEGLSRAMAKHWLFYFYLEGNSTNLFSDRFLKSDFYKQKLEELWDYTISEAPERFEHWHDYKKQHPRTWRTYAATFYRNSVAMIEQPIEPTEPNTK